MIPRQLVGRETPSPQPSPTRGEGAGKTPSPLVGEGWGEGAFGESPGADPELPIDEQAPPRWPRMTTLLLVAASYLAFASMATYPVVLTFGSEMPGQLTDPLEHLWIMRWSRACLLDGRSPFFCPALNYPSGVPLGYFPTMHIQTAAYVFLCLFTRNEIACFNAMWFFGFVSTGLGTFLLAWWTVRKAWAAWLAGLGTMLCGPMLMHAHGHLETMQVGAVPLFLIAWLRLVDRPGRGRLAIAAGLYLLVVACAPYFAVLAVFPAAWYVAWSWLDAGRGGRRSWLMGRVGWLATFAGLVLPGLFALFSGQVWAAGHGFTMDRPRSQFNSFGAPPWSSFVPSPRHALGRFAIPDVFAATGYTSRMSECSSYLGVVALGLLAYAAIRRVRFPRAGYWWSALGLMVVLSWGSQVEVGSGRIGMPAGWIYGIFPPFHLIRVPARFNLFAAVCAAVPVAAAVADLMGRMRGPIARSSLVLGCAGLTLADLAMVPFETSPIPPMPGIYRELTYRDPDTSVIDAPMFGSSEGQVFSSLWGYWQSIHRARTTAGYPGLPNVPFEAEIVRASPWWSGRLVAPVAGRFGAVEGVDERDYAWLYLKAHRFDHVVVHQGRWSDPKYRGGLDRIKALLAEGRVFEDADVAVIASARLRAPEHLTWLCGEGFRRDLIHPASTSYGVLREGRIVVANPTPDRPMIVSLVEVWAFARPRTVRLTEEGRELARWTIDPGAPRTLDSPPIRPGDGVRELRLESDGDDRPTRHAERLDDARTAYSLRLRAVRIRNAD